MRYPPISARERGNSARERLPGGKQATLSRLRSALRSTFAVPVAGGATIIKQKGHRRISTSKAHPGPPATPCVRGPPLSRPSNVCLLPPYRCTPPSDFARTKGQSRPPYIRGKWTPQGLVRRMVRRSIAGGAATGPPFRPSPERCGQGDGEMGDAHAARNFKQVEARPPIVVWLGRLAGRRTGGQPAPHGGRWRDVLACEKASRPPSYLRSPNLEVAGLRARERRPQQRDGQDPWPEDELVAVSFPSSLPPRASEESWGEGPLRVWFPRRPQISRA